MMQKCIRIADRGIFIEVERLERWVKSALFTQVKELRQSGEVSGIACDIDDEYVGVVVEVEVESIGYLSTKVYLITGFVRYKK